MANNFCRFLSNGFRIETDGHSLAYQPCCWFGKKLSFDHPNFLIEKQRISEISQWEPECNKCRLIEESGITNPPRLRSFNEIPDSSVPDNMPVWFELSIDTTCNAACLMCGPNHSTTWVKQEIKYGIKQANEIRPTVDPLIWFNKIKDTWPLDYVNNISFLGGEPLKSGIPVKFLKAIREIKDLSTVTIHIQTNGSVQPSPALVELMRECKRVRYNISLDGCGSHLEYIRYPLKWKKIVSSLEYVKSLNIPHLYFVVLSTINPLNAFYYDEIENWAEEFFKDFPRPDRPGFRRIAPNRCYGNLDLGYTPIKLRQAIIDKFGDDHDISKMFSNLPINSDTEQMINFVEYWDNHRKTNWKDTFAEIVKYYG
jgi:hypothetical protein